MINHAATDMAHLPLFNAARHHKGLPAQLMDIVVLDLVRYLLRNACVCFAISYGDHAHTCTQHIGATKDTHEHILSALDTVCKR
jgi:hypothetical protein